jgi:hypothetical protein
LLKLAARLVETKLKIAVSWGKRLKCKWLNLLKFYLKQNQVEKIYQVRKKVKFF